MNCISEVMVTSSATVAALSSADRFSFGKGWMMNRLMVSLSLFALLVLLLAGCNKSGADNDEGESSRAGNTVEPEAPAPTQPAGKGFVYNFDSDVVGTLPAKFHEALTGQGKKVEWLVKPDPSAPSPPNVIAQLSADKTDYRFPLAIADEGSFKDLALSVKFKAVSGEVDRAAGLVFRLKDANNYYIVRANALEDNYRLYRVVNGRRVQFAGANFKVASDEWHELRVECVGNHMTCYYNNEKKIDAIDDTFKDAGKVGLWTKADSVTYFDDLTVTAR